MYTDHRTHALNTILPCFCFCFFTVVLISSAQRLPHHHHPSSAFQRVSALRSVVRKGRCCWNCVTYFDHPRTIHLRPLDDTVPATGWSHNPANQSLPLINRRRRSGHALANHEVAKSESQRSRLILYVAYCRPVLWLQCVRTANYAVPHPGSFRLR